MTKPLRPRDFWCDYCGAVPGDQCRNGRGFTCPPHSSRVNQENAEWLRRNTPYATNNQK